jgi:predicted nucleic acid-binding Zn ribbon protein
MPMRDYFCKNCNAHTEVFQWPSEAILDETKFESCEKDSCPCENKTTYSGVGIKFVGPGFYVNDYKK